MLDFVLQLLRLLALGTLAYFLYHKLILVYYKYYFYTTQGIPSVGFPIPFINNGLQMKKALDKIKYVKWTVFEEYWYTALGTKVMPPLLVEFASPKGLLVITDPDMVQDLYFHKN